MACCARRAASSMRVRLFEHGSQALALRTPDTTLPVLATTTYLPLLLQALERGARHEPANAQLQPPQHVSSSRGLG